MFFLHREPPIYFQGCFYSVSGIEGVFKGTAYPETIHPSPAISIHLVWWRLEWLWRFRLPQPVARALWEVSDSQHGDEPYSA